MRPLALFDLDNTLIDRRAAFNAWAEEFAAAHQLDDQALTFVVMAGAHHSGPMDSFFIMLCATFDLSEPPDQLWKQYRRRMPELVSCHATDRGALQRLRRAGWLIGIVTNGMTDNQSAKIRNTGLGDLVDGWATSDEVGSRKPDPEIFRIVAARCGTTLEHGGWMIGDDLILDVAGGHAAGLRTIWLQPRPRTGPWSFIGPAPDVTVNSVTEAVEALLNSR
ncbi:HAD family hydrolase [Plantactinospora sp. CA-294935]|uniref:HAD family hydrolase n=1 Tax=Plantactinospora sp. CA-294935 TaxID=3240012 RepID=UPI003D92F436